MTKISFAVIGLGGRGSVYANFARHFGREVVAVCDADKSKLLQAQALGVTPENFFTDENEFFGKGKLADVLVISTLDGLHYGQAIRALELGYDLLLEKPIALTLKECEGIAEKAKKTGRRVVVCHVLRYSPFYGKIKELIKQKTCGDVVSLSMTENIGYYHFAHSYVRGNWRNEKVSAPLILAKNCHDLDMICWLLGERALTVSSYGSLKFFKPENAPLGCSRRCSDCKYKDDCPYSAFKIYNNNAYESIAGLAKHGRLTEGAGIDSNLSDLSNPYGRCCFYCDNDVVDHQVVNLEFDEGITAQFTSIAFTEKLCREINVYCTNGVIYGEDGGNVYYQRFGEGVTELEITFDKSGYGHHAGGDIGIIKQLIEYLENGIESDTITEIDKSVLSHKIGFLCEKSRKRNGKSYKI